MQTPGARVEAAAVAPVGRVAATRLQAAANNAGGTAGNAGSPVAGGSSTSGVGGNGGTGAAGSYESMGGGGGGGGYTGGGGGGSSSCGSALLGSGGGGGGASWISSSGTSTSFSGVTTQYESTSACPFGTDPGYGGDTPSTGTATAGFPGCAGQVASANFTGSAPGTPTESGSLSYTVGTAQSTATYAATGASSCDGTTTYCEFTLASGALPTGLTLNTSTGQISGTPSGTAGSYTFTVTATNPYGTSTATATQTLALAEGRTKLAFNTTPGTTANGVTLAPSPW